MKKSIFVFVCFLSSFAIGQNSTRVITTYLTENLTTLELTPLDIDRVVIESESFSQSMNVFNVYTKQYFQNTPIFNAIGTFAIRDNRVVYANVDFVSGISEKINTTTPTLSPQEAISSTITNLKLGASTGLELVTSQGNNTYTFSDPSVSTYDIPVKLVYFQKEEELRLAWDLAIDVPSGAHYYSVRVDAVTGALLDVADLVLSCTFENTKHNHSEHAQSVLFKQEGATAPANSLGNGPFYNVFPMPFTSPVETESVGVGDVSNTVASPFGWHDVNGTAGAEFTITRGNNVYAYEDLDGNNNTIGDSPDGGINLIFDFDYNLPADPDTFTEAATVNLFYWNNITHDVMYQYGFDEPSGNFQQNNYGNGGLGGDFVNAQAQDASGINNANFLTPQDGIPGRMQMFLFNPPGEVLANLFTVNEGPLAGGYLAFDSNFDGTPLPTDVPITATLVLAEDDNASAESEDIYDGCDTLLNANDLNGNIVVIRRGGCNFTVKVAAAEAAGAVGVVIVNNQSTDPFGMGGDGAGIGIPAVMIYAAEGEALINALINGETLTGTLFDDGTSEDDFFRDGSLDATVIVHEYAHGISNRLTAGPNNVLCLRTCAVVDDAGNCIQFTEQMGEGWSDWYGLMLTMKSSDTAEKLRGIGAYDRGQGVFGLGFRTNHYTTDLEFNPLTYAATNSNAQSAPHGVGTVWATMLWDLTWAYIDTYGFDEDIYNGTGGNNQVIQLVTDAMKLQACQPGFVDGRDAILAADELATGGANRCLIWETFAARGLGRDAEQGSRFDRFDQVQNFDIPQGPDCLLSTAEVDAVIDANFKVFPNPTNGFVNIKTAVALGEVSVAIYDLNGRKVFTEETVLNNIATLQVASLQAGVYVLEISNSNYTFTTKLVLE